MIGQLENLAAIGALAFEHRAGVVQAVRQNMDFGVCPFDKFAVHPDEPVEFVEGNGCHWGNLPRAGAHSIVDLSIQPGINEMRRPKLGALGHEGKLKEIPEKAVRACLFVRNSPKSLAKIIIGSKICQWY